MLSVAIVRSGLGLVALAAAGLWLSGCSTPQLAAEATKRMTRQEPPPRPEPPPSQAAVPPVKPGGIYKVGNPYQVAGIWYTPKEDPGYDETGIASWYGHPFHGKVTANGETYDMNDMTAAHKTLPMPVMVRVTNLENGRQLVLRVNDRGPFVHGRIIDVSRRGAQLLGFEGKGTARVRVQVIAPVFDGPGPQFVPPVETAPEERLAVAAPREVVTAESLPPAPGTQVAGPLPPRPAAREPDPPPRNAARSPSPPQPRPSTQAPRRPPANAAPPPSREEVPPGVRVIGVEQTRLYVQAGAFAQQDRAQAVVQRLQPIGQAFVQQVDVGGRNLFRVRLGPLHTVEQADYALDRAIQAGMTEARIVVDQ